MSPLAAPSEESEAMPGGKAKRRFQKTFRTPLLRHIVLVLVVVLVLERVWRYVVGAGIYLCALSELHPVTAGLEMLSGRAP